MNAINERSVLPQNALEELLGFLRSLEGVPGDVLEAGSFRCGTTVEMARAAPQRRVFAFDAFGGYGALASFRDVDFEEVKRYVADYPNVQLVRGNHRKTIPQFKGSLAMAFLDADTFVSTLMCLRHLAPMVSPGGAFVLNDWPFVEVQTAARNASDSLQGWTAQHMPSGLYVYRRPS